LSIDATKFDAAQKKNPTAVLAALTKWGQTVDKAATSELATNGNVSGSVSSLTQRATALQSQQSAMLKLQQSIAAAQNNSSGSYSGYGLAAYKSNS